MKKLTLSVLVLSLLFVSQAGKAQRSHPKTWVDELQNPNATFYDVQKAFYKQNARALKEMERNRQRAQQHQASHPNKIVLPGQEEEQELNGFELFKRYEYFASPRVFPTGDRSLLNQTHQNYEAYLQTRAQQRAHVNNTVQANSWSFLGPLSEPAGGGVGRVNCVAIDPVTPSTLWVGAADGGLWKTTNTGGSWATTTDLFTDLGVSDIAINPTNNQIMFVATGDKDGSFTGGSAHAASFGIQKSTDGGNTWTNVYPLTVSAGNIVSRIIIDPSNTQNIYAAGSFGIIKSTDGGTTWSNIYSGETILSMEFKPATSTTIYAAGRSFHLSTNSGGTWSTITSGLPTSTQAYRLQIAVTAANSAYCYVLASDATNYSCFGVYQSTNSGTSFTQKHGGTSPNLLGYNQNGSDAGSGQGFYTISIAASPTNASEVMVGGVNIWKSTDGGATWGANAITYWAASHTATNYVHADIHHILYGSGTVVYTGCDGGIFTTTNDGVAWSDLSTNLQIAQMYGLGMSTTNANKILTGWQDNGTNLMTASTSWSEVLGGDGMKCFIDWSNDNTMYGEQYNGSFNRSTNSGGSWTSIGPPSGESTAWATPWKQDPTTSTTIYGGQTNLYKSTNQGTSWTVMGTMPDAAEYINEFAIAPTSSQVIYVVKNSGVFKTTNGGTSWSTITGTIPTGSAAASYVAICPTNANIAYVTLSGYSSGNKVYVTNDGGTTWTNYSTGLPNLPANCITYQKNAHGAVYVGMDVGVYYRDSTLGSWQPYNSGLPNTPVTQMEIYYNTGKIRAATFGRGMWEIPVNNPGLLAPVANFTANTTLICPGMAVNFTDLSGYNPTTWSWTFQGGTPGTSTVQNPTNIVYNTPGTYSVTLTVSNANGSNTMTQTTYITVSGTQVLPLVEGFQGGTFVPANWNSVDAGSDGLIWAHNTTVGGYSTSTACAMYDNYNLNCNGFRDEMQTPKYNFTGLSSASLKFDVAYAQYNATYSDTLEVLISTNCGSTWTSIYLKGGVTLSTNGGVGVTAAQFVPTSTQWRTETISLNSYINNASVLVSFKNRGHFGQTIYLDNVNITGVTALAPVANFTASATTVCAGGSISFTDNSTNSPTSWSWTFPGGTPGTSTLQNPTNIVFSTAGTYTVSLTASNGSGNNTHTQVITVNALPTITSTAGTPSICVGGSTGLTASGGTTYSWSPATGLSSTTVANPTATPTVTTTYTVTGTNASGCSNTSTVTVTVNPLPTITTTPATPAFCAGGNIGLTASGASTYSWSPATGLSSTTVANPTASPASTTTYTVTGTSAAGCSNTHTTTVTVNPLPTITSSATTPNICVGGSTGLTAGGGSTYSWSPSTGLSSTTSATPTATPASTITYTVTGTSAAGCSNTSTVTVTVNALPTITSSAGTPTICAGGSTGLTASGGTTYSWSPATGLSSTTVANPTATPTVTTTYTVTGTNASGCSNTSTVTVTVNPLPTITTTPATPAFCAGGSIGLTASGASTYSWSPATGLSSTTVANPTASPASTTTYTVTGTSAAGCSNTQTTTVTVNPLPTITSTAGSPTICVGGNSVLTASGGTTYSWSPASGLSSTTVANPTATPTVTTTYTVTGTNASGCSNTSTVTVTVNPAVVAGAGSNTAICNGSSTTLNGTGGGTYSWSPSTGLSSTTIANPVASPTVTTTYTVTVTSGTCTASATVTVTVNPLPAVPTITAAGSVLTASSTGVTYQWYLNSSPIPGATSQSYTATTSGSYTVVVTDSNGCSSTSAAYVLTITGIADPSSGTSFSIFPNPNNGVFELTFSSNEASDYQINIFNALGQVVSSESISNLNGQYHKTIDLSPFGAGVYMVSLTNAKHQTVKKVVIY